MEKKPHYHKLRSLDITFSLIEYSPMPQIIRIIWSNYWMLEAILKQVKTSQCYLLSTMFGILENIGLIYIYNIQVRSAYYVDQQSKDLWCCPVIFNCKNCCKLDFNISLQNSKCLLRKDDKSSHVLHTKKILS